MQHAQYAILIQREWLFFFSRVLVCVCVSCAPKGDKEHEKFLFYFSFLFGDCRRNGSLHHLFIEVGIILDNEAKENDQCESRIKLMWKRCRKRQESDNGERHIKGTGFKKCTTTRTESLLHFNCLSFPSFIIPIHLGVRCRIFQAFLVMWCVLSIAFCWHGNGQLFRNNTCGISLLKRASWIWPLTMS